MKFEYYMVKEIERDQELHESLMLGGVGLSPSSLFSTYKDRWWQCNDLVSLAVL